MSSARPAPSAGLPAATLPRLADGAPVLLLSADRWGRPHATYSWAVALAPRRLCIAVDRGGRTSANWLRSGQAAVQVIGAGGSNLLIGGRAVRLPWTPVCAPTMEAWQLAVRTVLDQAWPGVVTSALRYRGSGAGGAAALRRFERALCRELRDTPGVARV
ncbi:MAG: hypothetical protein HS128_09240 [Ideonella sp.]|nr:hypothetical protein [Ideonella sp.]MCC7456473.1 hypothetical protein [Nitrospira sp.]